MRQAEREREGEGRKGAKFGKGRRPGGKFGERAGSFFLMEGREKREGDWEGGKAEERREPENTG